MAFKLPGKSMTSGTSSHSSALKMREHKIASAFKETEQERLDNFGNDPETIRANEEWDKNNPPADDKKTPPKKDKKAYGGDRTWAEGQKGSGNTLNDTTKKQKAYEKEMKAKDSKWNKKDDNEWKKRQNTINASLGSKKVYDTIKESKTKLNKEGVETVKGLGFNKDKTLSEKEAQKQQITRDIARNIIQKGKDDDNKTTVLKGKSKLRSSQAGDQDQYTGTVASRTVGKINKAIVKGKQKRNEKRKTKLEEKYKRRTAKGKSTERLEKRYAKKGGDASTLGTEDDKK